MLKKFVVVLTLLVVFLGSCASSAPTIPAEETEFETTQVTYEVLPTDGANEDDSVDDDSELKSEVFYLPIQSIHSKPYSSVCEYTEYGDTVEYYHTETGKDTVSVYLVLGEEGEINVMTKLTPPQFRSFIDTLGLKGRDSEYYPYKTMDTFFLYPDDILNETTGYFIEGNYVDEGLVTVGIININDTGGNHVWDLSMESPPRDMNSLEMAFINTLGGWDSMSDWAGYRYGLDIPCPYGPSWGIDWEYNYLNWSIYETETRTRSLKNFIEGGYWLSVNYGTDEYDPYSPEYRWLDSAGNVLLPEEDNIAEILDNIGRPIPYVYQILRIPDDGLVTLQKRYPASENTEWEFVTTVYVQNGDLVEVGASSEFRLEKYSSGLSLSVDGGLESYANFTVNWSEEKILDYYHGNYMVE